MKLRDLPSVDELLRDERLSAEPHDLAVTAARSVLARARVDIAAGTDPGPIAELVLEELARARRPSLRRVLNATGVLVHTNLGRAPLAEPRSSTGGAIPIDGEDVDETDEAGHVDSR